MIDKNDARERGLFDLLDSIKYGHMRYGENIFDQQSSLIQDGILASDLPDAEKQRLLGIHIFDELKTHPNHMEAFATGGKTKPKPKAKVKASTYFNPAGNTAELINARNLYNSWAQANNLPQLQAGSDFNDSTAAAFANYNADPTNGRKLNVRSTAYVDPSSGETRRRVTEIGLDKFIPDAIIKPMDLISGFNRKGEAVYGDQILATDFDKKSGKLLVANEDYFPTAVDQTQPQKPNSSTQVDGREARQRAFRNENIVGNLTSLANVGIGGILSSEAQPKYDTTEEYQRMRDDIYSRKDQGLTAEQIAAMNQDINNNYAQGLESIRQIGGGGANAGAVLSTIQGLSSNADRARTQNSLINIDARNRNQSIYRDAVLRDQSLDQQLFEQERLNALETKQNGLAMVSQGVQAINDRSMYNQAYGPDSMYNDLLESQIAGAQQYRDTQALQTELALENLRKAAGIGTLPVNPNTTSNIRQLPLITIPR